MVSPESIPSPNLSGGSVGSITVIISFCQSLSALELYDMHGELFAILCFKIKDLGITGIAINSLQVERLQ